MISLILSILLSGLTFSSAYANVKSLNRVTEVKIKQNDEKFQVFVSFDKPLDKRIKRPLLGGNYIQYTFPGTYVNPSKKLIRAGKGPVEKAILYQYNRRTTRLRVFIDSKKLNRNMFERTYLKKSGKNIIAIKYSPQNKIYRADSGQVGKRKTAGEVIAGSHNNIKEEAITDADSKADILSEIDKRTEKIKGENKKKVSSSDKDSFLFNGDKSLKKSEKKGVAGAHLSKMFISLGLVIALMLAIAWLFKKFTSGGARISINNKMIKVITREYIGAKNYLAVVMVMDKYLLLGITPDSITALAEIEDIQGEFLEKKKREDKLEDLPGKKGEVLKDNAGKNVFEKVINEVSGGMKSLKTINSEKGNGANRSSKDLAGLKKIGKDMLERRAIGLEGIEKENSEDPFISNLTGMIKNKIKDLPQL